MLKIFMTVLVALQMCSASAAIRYEPVSSSATINYYQHPAPLVATKTSSNPSYPSSPNALVAIPRYGMVYRIWDEGVREITSSSPVHIERGSMGLQFFNLDRLNNDRVVYRHSFNILGDRPVDEKITIRNDYDDGRAVAEVYCTIPYLTSDSYESEITVRTRATVTGMINLTGYDNNMAEGICTWVFKPVVPELRLEHQQQLNVQAPAFQDAFAQTRIWIREKNTTSSHRITFTVAPTAGLSFRNGDLGGPYEDRMEYQYGVTGTEKGVLLDVKIKGRAGGTYEYPVRVTAELT
ncbi:TPA: hypothetical protein JLE96_004763 [Escherichia coli]|nr:hypothetical protein [Escherichia coli]